MELDYVGLGILITALGAVIVNVITSLRTSTKVANVEAVVTAVQAKSEVIANSVDGAATKATEIAASLRSEIGSLRSQLNEEKQRGALQAQTISGIAQSTKATEAGVKELNGHAPAEASLKQIEKNTEATAKNTARTDVAVEQLKKDA